MSPQLAVNAPHVVHETIDGETILIHLGTGTYYSLDGTGAEVWALASCGATREDVVVSMQARYQADPQELADSVTALVQEMVDEELLTVADATASPIVVADEAAGESAAMSGAVFDAPVLHKYTDMQEFMLVDPLHDVEADAGWPHVKAG
jgi:hypothetical protein